jgi:hypothetical protein
MIPNLVLTDLSSGDNHLFSFTTSNIFLWFSLQRSQYTDYVSKVRTTVECLIEKD